MQNRFLTNNNQSHLQINKRNEALDSLAGIFLFLMMLQHFNILTMAPFTLGHIFMFNTIWFFWKAGMFHRPQKLSWTIVIKLIRKFIVPFVILILFAMALFLFSEYIIGSKTNVADAIYSFCAQTIHNGAPWWNIPLWFLLTLFFVKIVTCNYGGGHAPIWMIICLIIGTFHYYKIGEDFNYIGNCAIATLFYVLGYHSKNIHLNKYWYISLTLIYVFILLFAPCALDIYGNKPRYGNYYLSIIACISGIMVINKLFEYFKRLHIKPLIFLGQNAMVFLIFHVPFAMFIRQTIGIKQQSIEPYVEFLISMPVCFAICIFFNKNKNLNWIIGG